MKITIESIEVNGDVIEAVTKLKATLSEDARYGARGIHDSDIQHFIVKAVSDSLAEKMLLERGPKIMEEITNNQIINAVIMKVAGSLGRN